MLGHGGWSRPTIGSPSGAVTQGDNRRNPSVVQNYPCAAQAAAVLVALAVTGAWPAAWWLDPAIGLGIAAVAVREGTQSWRGDDCC